MIRSLMLGVALLASLAIGFFATLAVLDRRAPPGAGKAVVVEKEAMRCEVLLPRASCPAQRDFKGVAADGIVYDNWDGTGSNMEKCLARAAQFHNWCKSTEPVVARFYRDHSLIGQERFPK